MYERTVSQELPLLLTPRQAARFLGFSERWLWERTRQGLVPYIVLSVGRGGRRTVRYPRPVLEEWARRQTRWTAQQEADRATQASGQ
jgi:hypothetical protein